MSPVFPCTHQFDLCLTYTTTITDFKIAIPIEIVHIQEIVARDLPDGKRSLIMKIRAQLMIFTVIDISITNKKHFKKFYY